MENNSKLVEKFEKTLKSFSVSGISAPDNITKMMKNSVKTIKAFDKDCPTKKLDALKKLKVAKKKQENYSASIQKSVNHIFRNIYSFNFCYNFFGKTNETAKLSKDIDKFKKKYSKYISNDERKKYETFNTGNFTDYAKNQITQTMSLLDKKFDDIKNFLNYKSAVSDYFDNFTNELGVAELKNTFEALDSAFVKVKEIALKKDLEKGLDSGIGTLRETLKETEKEYKRTFGKIHDTVETLKKLNIKKEDLVKLKNKTIKYYNDNVLKEEVVGKTCIEECKKIIKYGDYTGNNTFTKDFYELYKKPCKDFIDELNKFISNINMGNFTDAKKNKENISNKRKTIVALNISKEDLENFERTEMNFASRKEALNIINKDLNKWKENGLKKIDTKELEKTMQELVNEQKKYDSTPQKVKRTLLKINTVLETTLNNYTKVLDALDATINLFNNTRSLLSFGFLHK